MEIPYLRELMEKFDELEEFHIEYIGKPMLWLEPKPENISRQKRVKLMSYAIKLFPIRGKILSPFIAIYAKK